MAAEIAEKCGRAVTVTDFNSVTGDWDLIVNGTPVGMFPKVDACPLEPGVLAHTAAVFDAIYNPMETRLLCLARQNGAKVVNGLPMLVWQAAVAQEIWNDVTYTPAQVQRVIEQMEELL